MSKKNKYYPRDDVEYWFTANGNHIPVKAGQTREEALNAFLKAHGDPRGKSVEELRREQAVDSDGLTAEERRIWREACERISRGFKGIAPKVGRQYFVSVGNRKIAITSGKYPNFKIQRVFTYDNAEDQEEELRRLWGKTQK